MGGWVPAIHNINLASPGGQLPLLLTVRAERPSYDTRGREFHNFRIYPTLIARASVLRACVRPGSKNCTYYPVFAVYPVYPASWKR